VNSSDPSDPFDQPDALDVFEPVDPLEPVAPPGGTVAAVTTDGRLADELQRLAAAAGVALDLLGEVPPRVRWPHGLVLVGADVARAAGRRGVPAGGSQLVVVGLDDVLSPAQEEQIWQHAVAAGAEQVALLPQAHEWLIGRMARAVEPVGAARVVGVVGGCGGAGATMLATTLAVVAAELGRRTLLVDVDPLGGGIDLAVGLDDVVGLRWPDLASARGRLPAASLHSALPRAGSLAVLGWGRGDPVDLAPAAVDSVLDAARRGHDLVVVDLPRSFDAVADAALAGVDQLLVVVPARLRAVASSTQVVAALGGRARSTAVVVRRAPDDRWSAHQVADALGLPLAAQLRDEPHLDADLDQSLLPGQRSRSPLRRAAEQCLSTVAGERAA
jgi:secretion/DNA translocation related CpaE-like protein